MIWYTLNKVLKHSLNLLADLRFFFPDMELLPTDLSLTFLETWKLGETCRCTYVEYTCYLLIHSKVLDTQNRPGNRSIPIGYEAIKVVAGWNMLELLYIQTETTVMSGCHPDWSTDRPFVGAQDLWKLAVNLSWFLQRYLKIMTKIQGCSEPSKFFEIDKVWKRNPLNLTYFICSP